MGKNDKYKYMRSISIPLHQEDRIALEERQLRLQKVLEQRRQAASTEASTATPSTSGSADPVTETPAVPDNKEGAQEIQGSRSSGL